MNTVDSPAMQAQVLALNRYYSAVHIVSVRRAFCLLVKGFAEVVSVENGSYMAYDFSSWQEISELRCELDHRDEKEDWIRTVNFQIQVPRIIRLLHYDRIPQHVVKFNRRNIFLRDQHCCQYCGRRYSQHKLSLDHVIPRSQQGATNWENVVTACLRCNGRKGGRTPQEAGMALQRRPFKPKRNPVLTQRLASNKYAVWRNFLETADSREAGVS